MEAVMRWNRVLMIVVLAAIGFGGTFTCTSSTHDDHHDHHSTTVTNG
jgi:hypothetical protein